MKNSGTEASLIEIAFGIIVADGFFCLAYLVHLAGNDVTPSLIDFLAMGAILCVFLSACWVIYDAHWGALSRDVVKKLHIRELRQGASIEYDGKWYRVENIDRRSGQILIERIGCPGRIIVHIEGLQ